ncbi:MAG: hypothetical protein CME64_01750 [Halobacteriovoraceae bacterium]|nr:hypothetical protein [Halobacteriovoraceae bacterium]
MKLVLAFLIFNISNATANETFQAVLSKMYPDCKLKKEILFLTSAQLKQIKGLSKSSVKSKLANRFKTCSGSYVYVDSHIVRTLNQTVVAEVTSDNKVKMFTVSAFLEPKEYKAPKKWLGQLFNKKLPELELNTKIDGLSGATLTAKANVGAAKKILAMHQVLSGE